MKAKALNITKSASFLFVTFVATWFFIACIGEHTKTPSRDPWTWFQEYYIPPFPFVVAPWIAARFWYGLPVFFGFGSFFVLPVGYALFGPEMRHGFITAMPPYFVCETLTFCCTGGFVAALIGWCVHRLRIPTAPNSNCDD